MNVLRRVYAAGLMLGLSLPGASIAADFDGSANLICAAVDVVACAESDRGALCTQGHARAFELSEFFRIDFAKKEIRATGSDRGPVVSAIRNHEKTATQVIMQGVEEDRGWTAIVGQDDGALELTVSGQGLGFMIFGACTPL